MVSLVSVLKGRHEYSGADHLQNEEMRPAYFFSGSGETLIIVSNFPSYLMDFVAKGVKSRKISLTKC